MNLPEFPYGAVYFRKSNPPREDWERDYATAAEDGYNIFRHWFMWSAIEVQPGVYDWADYDRQFDLAAKHGIKTIIAEMITAAPEWLYHRFPEAQYLRSNGEPHQARMGVSSATGGFYGLSLDHDEIRARAGDFLSTLAERYRDHPAMGGYDVWNECNYNEDVSYTPATLGVFQKWLRERYGTLEALGEAWGRHSFENWGQVTPPRKIEMFADSLDWLEFLQDNAYRHMKWRVDTIRAVDANNLISAHGVAASIVSAANRGSDDWRAASEVDLYGFTWVASRQGDMPYQHLHAVDLTRAACRGKPFWHAEAQGGPLWMQPQVLGRRLDDGRITQPEDIRIWNMTTFAGGARGLLYPRWRPLLDGPLFGAFGPYGMDGGRTARSEMTSRIAKWATSPQQRDLWKSRPVKGEIGLVFAPETQALDFALQGNMRTYTSAMRGAYQAFFENNIQADFVHIDDIEQYEILYLSYPIMLKARTAEKLRSWVDNGGTLISEGLPGYFGDRARVGVRQPNHDMDALFGARETDVVFAPDLFEDLALEVNGFRIEGGAFRQSYEPNGGNAVGWYEDKSCAAVEHRIGAGKTLLVGTFPSLGFFSHHREGTRQFFRSLLGWAGRQPRIETTNTDLTARLQDGDGGRFLFVLNHSRQSQSGVLSLSDQSPSSVERLWGDAGSEGSVKDNKLSVSVGPRDALVLALR